VCTAIGSILTQRRSCALKCIPYWLKGIHMHSEHVQVHSSAFNARSKAIMHTQSAFKRDKLHSHSLKGVHVHSITCRNQEGSVVFRLTQRCSRALKHIQLSSMLTQRHLRALRACSRAFKCIQYSHKGINVHSERIQARSIAFSGGHTHSKKFSLVRQIKAQWICA
jgi:hypothetical protein